MSLKQNQEDQWVWTADSSVIFSVSSAYRVILDLQYPLQHSTFFSVIWKLKVPPKIKFFIWRIALNRVATRDNLRKRGILITDDEYKCPFCSLVEQSISHLLFQCPCSSLIWSQWYSKVGILTASPWTVEAHFNQHYVFLRN